MENVTLVNGRENELEFDISIQGVNKKEPLVRFVVESEPISYSFQCHRGEDDKWVVNIPIIPLTEDNSYPFQLEIIVDGYYFEPLQGTVTAINAPSVKTKDAHMLHPKPTVNQVKITNKEQSTSFAPLQKPKEQITTEKEEVAPLISKKVNKRKKVEHPPKTEKRPEPPKPKVEESKDDFQDVVDLIMGNNDVRTASTPPSVKEKDNAVRGILEGLKSRTSEQSTNDKSFASTIDKESLMKKSCQDSIKELEEQRKQKTK